MFQISILKLIVATTYDVKRCSSDVRSNIDSITIIGLHFVVSFSQFFDQHLTLFVENVKKIFQNFEVKSRS